LGCRSSTVIMKIDLVGPARRGLAMGLNEAVGPRTPCHAMEIDPIYVEVALRRWERFSGDKAERIDG
jgi:hypothetical protein